MVAMNSFGGGYNILPLQTINGGHVYFNREEVNCLHNNVQEMCNNCATIKLPEEVVKHVVILDSYSSATIEGARTTIDSVVSAMSKPKQDINTSDRMVLNAINAMNYLCKHNLSIDDFINAWKLMVEDVCENKNAGTDGFRNGNVTVASLDRVVHVPETPERIEERMKQLFAYLEDSNDSAVIKSIVFHFYCVYVHPFCDGNGRIARATSSAYLGKNGFEFFSNVPVSKVINESLSRYYHSIAVSEELHKNNIDITPFVVYMLHVYRAALQQYSLLQSPLDIREGEVLSKLVQRGKGTISIGKCAKILKCSEQEALQVLNSMYDKGYLVYVGGEYRIGWRV